MNVITIEGKDYELKFGFNAIDHFCKAEKINLIQFWDKIQASKFQDIGMVRDMLYSCMTISCIINNTDKVFSNNLAVGEWFDEVGIDYITHTIVPALVGSLISDKKKAKSLLTEQKEATSA